MPSVFCPSLPKTLPGLLRKIDGEIWMVKSAMRILSPGFGITTQDLGRPDSRHLGVPPSGAMDDYAHRVANWLVGNTAGCATLEIPLVGPCIEMLTTADIAVTGARQEVQINGVTRRQWQSIRVQPGDLLKLGAITAGCRTYCAITGGLAVDEVMGSRSTSISGTLGGLGGLGGYKGRMLAQDDILPRGEQALLAAPRCLPWEPIYPEHLVVRAIAGPHDQWFQGQGDAFWGTAFTLSAQSNRMGCRLLGPIIARDAGAPASILSEPIGAGNIQVPADGQPIVVIREQTMGGYTVIATIISADLWRLGQAKPGDRLSCIRVSLADGQRIGRTWRAFLADVERLLCKP